ncbi:MAG: sigma 54-interacting transcriptional regulator [Polyangiaceae bacterium]
MTSDAGDAGRPLRLGPRTQQRLAVELTAGPQRGLCAEPRASSTLQIGRATDNELQLKGADVAPYHVDLVAREDGVWVVDLGGASGTWLDDLRLERAVIPYGNELRVGEHRLRVTQEAPVELGREEIPDAALPLVAFARRYREALALAARFAAGRVPVLLCGEPGTGKRFLARLVHGWSGRGGALVECSAAGDATAVAARLFGHAPRSHRGAELGGAGSLQRARGGTLFLANVERLPLEVQGLLSRALRDGSASPLGSNQPLALDARWVFATGVDLRPLVNRGYFLEELYFRMAAARVEVPPLRERLEDLELLVRHFEALLGVEDPIGPGVVERLRRRYFHENLRELAQLVRAARCEPELAGETTHHD